MITIEQARKIDPRLADVSDAELEAVLNEQEEMGKLALECYLKYGSNIPDGLLPTEPKKE